MFSKRNHKKFKKDEVETAQVFQDFLHTFQGPCTSVQKTFIRSGVLNSDREPAAVGEVYNPKPFISIDHQKNDVEKAIECARLVKPASLSISTKSKKGRHLSNLEALKEELKLKHEHDRLKSKLKLEKNSPISNLQLEDSNSTNLFISNLTPSFTENKLMLHFGGYGPLASVKIMWPKLDSSCRGAICGFVAFMSRKDAERALKENQDRDDMKVKWGKSIEIPSHPVYIPNALMQCYLPPASTGLPFNAQLPGSESVISQDLKEYGELLQRCSVKVVIPLNKVTLHLIHRMVEFVIREGPMFEAFIMSTEIKNPDFNFLFNYQSPEHIYYRWKLFSILNGDFPKQWSMKPFRMFKGGSVWLPPVIHDYSVGMPEKLLHKQKLSKKLTSHQCEKLIRLIQGLTMARPSIAKAMSYCMDHKDAINDCIEIILESLSNEDTILPNKIARLYLLSDVLANCQIMRINTQLKHESLLKTFTSLNERCNKVNTARDKEEFKSRILKTLNYWSIVQIFPSHLVKQLEEIFEENLDDDSSMDEPLDGTSLLKRCRESSGPGPAVITSEDRGNTSKVADYFVPSKWDTLDPEEVKAQAVSVEDIAKMERESKTRKRSKLITIDLNDLLARKARLQKLKSNFQNFEKFTAILTWEPPEECICPSTVAKYFADMNYHVKLCSPYFNSKTEYSVKVPTIDLEKSTKEEFVDFLEWIGMVAIGGDLETNDQCDYVNGYVTPVPNEELGQVKCLTWRGLFTATQVQKLVEETMKFNDAEGKSWITIYIQGYSDAPISWDNEEHHYFTNGDNSYALIFGNEGGVFCVQKCSKKCYK